MSCRICGSTALRLYYTQGNQGECRYFQCRNCKLVNYDLAGGLDQEKYAAEYPDPFMLDHPRNRPQTATFRFLERHLSPPGRLLDIGCGNGRLLHLAREAGWSVSGLELSPFLAESVIRKLGIDVTVANISEPDLAERLGPEPFDVIVLRHVLEHLPDPLAVMALFRRLLSDRGHVVLEFPNIEGFHMKSKRWLQRIGLYFKTYPPGYHPGHCNEYCRESFQHLVDRTGFDLLVWETYSSNPVRDWIFNRWPIGIKARTLIRKRPPPPCAAGEPD